MRRALAVLPVVLCLAWAGGAPAATPKYRLTRVARLEFPTGMALTPSGDTLFVNERAGRIRIIRNGKLLRTPFARIDTTTSGEAGLLGLALDPKFEQGQPWVYVFFSLPDGSADRVERLRFRNDRAVDRQVLIGRLPSGALYHHGGAMAFGPDGKLYVSNGEAHRASRAQDPRVLGGKIYRINPGGSIPPDNPFHGERTWSYGHRNPFGLAFDPKTGRLWESENGPENHDEVNLIRKGRNYGWPIVRGDTRRSGYVPAVVDYERIVVPTGLAFAPSAFPRAALYLGTFGEGALHELTLNAKRDDVTRDRVIAHPAGGVIALATGSNAIYVATPSGVLKLRAKGAASPKPSPSASKPASVAPSPSASATGERTAHGFGIGFVIITAAAAAGYGLARFLRRSNRPRPKGPWFGGRAGPS